MGDLSHKGIAESYGIMVNYLYDLAEIERNHEAYANERAVVASSVVKNAAERMSARRAALPAPIDETRARGAAPVAFSAVAKAAASP